MAIIRLSEFLKIKRIKKFWDMRMGRNQTYDYAFSNYTDVAIFDNTQCWKTFSKVVIDNH